MKKSTLLPIIIIVALIFILAILLVLTIGEANRGNRAEMDGQNPGGRVMQEESTQKETTAEDVEEGTTINETEVNLSNYSSNITITEAGSYVLTGEFEHSILVNASGTVTLNLNSVTVKNTTTAAIANISNNPLIVNLVENTTSTLSDGGSSEYDGCIYSSGDLIISGNGTLYVYGNQTEGEGIATETRDITINGGTIYIESQDDGINAGGDGGTITINNGTIHIKASGDGIDSNLDLIINDGYVYTMGSSVGGDAGIDTEEGFSINGGTVIALGSDMLEKPLSSSTQKSICFNLSTKIQEGTTVSLRNEAGDEVISFEAEESFSTLIISNASISSGTYTIYQNGTSSNISETVE